jgi:glyoxalase family protein
MTASLITGVHHVTAFASDPIANRRFYTEVLGLRLVKRTVNFDDPSTHHLYYGDRGGAPGTLLTHFPSPRTARGRHGGGEISETVMSVGVGTLDAWQARLERFGVGVDRRIGAVEPDRPSLHVGDPDDMRIALVEDASVAADASMVGPIERVVLSVADGEATAAFLTSHLGFGVLRASKAGIDLAIGDTSIPAPGQRLSLRIEPDRTQQPMGAGTVHHVAWRVPTDTAQASLRTALVNAGIAVTPILDRQYFRSIYFRVPCGHPNGIVFEVATDGPGFAVDEPLETLGTRLMLPPRYEARRSDIERLLPALDGEADGQAVAAPAHGRGSDPRHEPDPLT